MNLTMKLYTSLRKIFLVSLASFSLASASASRPEDVDASWSCDCFGFPVDVRLAGKVIYLDGIGRGVWTGVAINWQTTYTNPENGKSVTVRQSGAEVVLSETLTEDGLLIVTSLLNDHLRLIVPGVARAISVGPTTATYVYDLNSGSLVSMDLQPLTPARRDNIDALIGQLLAP